MRAERQAAVQAVLEARHIPAGMELFAAGNESQLLTIRRWIDDSDCLMLLLGGRYGSLEPTTQTSYIELEYRYALQQSKPVFALVASKEALDAKLAASGEAVLESEHIEKLQAFKSDVLSRMCIMFSDTKDIQLGIFKTLSEFTVLHEFAGWISGKEVVNNKGLIDEMTSLREANQTLSDELQRLRSQVSPANNWVGDLSSRLKTEKLEGSEYNNVFNALIKNRAKFASGVGQYDGDDLYEELAPILDIYGLVYSDDSNVYWLTEKGRQFLTLCKLK